MLVYVDNTPVQIFSGATALDALRRYCTNEVRPLPAGDLFDFRGNVIAPDSPMTEGRRIFTRLPL